MIELLAQLTRWLSPYFNQMSLMLVATLLVVFGDIINKYVKQVLKPCHFIIRVSLFVLLCAFGYGALTLFGAPFVLHLIHFFPGYLQGLVFVSAFFAVGLFAERRRYL
tara:strand:- start:71 stop:394 length:324 start_codon:yes stop_codon:yes gene_type:complete